MANKSKRVGTQGENYVVDKYKRVFGPLVDRAPTNNPGDDLNAIVPIPTEIRRRDRWEPQAWARAQQEKFGDVWSIVMLPRDRRLKTAPPDVIVFPLEFGLDLLDAYFNGNAPEALRI